MKPSTSIAEPKLARFRIVRELGSGAQGQVYEAIDLERNVRIALKTLRALGSDDIVRFKTEFRAVRDLRHPNLVTLGELIEEAGRWYFTMELVDGVDFLAHVREESTLEDSTSWPARRGSVPRTRIDTRVRGPRVLEVEAAPASMGPRLRGTFHEARLRETLKGLVTGIAALHRAGKIHRDLKPSNVLIDGVGRVVLIDFGVVAELAADEGEDGQIIGTVPYMAPEQALGEGVSPAADWYAVGVLLFEALTGKQPFEGPSADVIERKCLLDAPRPSDFLLDVPEDLEALCVRLLARDPSKRPDDEEMLALLVGPVASEIAPSMGSIAPSGALFVGRDRELAALDEAYARAMDGSLVTVFLEGESGVGKSALAMRFVDKLRESTPKLVVLSGRCHEQERVPYNAFDAVIDALARYMRGRREALRDQLLPPRMDRLRRLFPAIGMIDEAIARATPPAPIEARAEREDAFAALRELLRRVAMRRPCVVLIEDIQWADADSLALLEALTDPRAAPPLLLLATARSQAGGASCAAVGAVRGDARRIAIGGLAPEAAEELAMRLVAQRGGGMFDAVAILRGSHGHPMFIEELVRYAAPPHAPDASMEGARESGQDGSWALDDALWARVQTLAEPAQRALAVIAAAGVPTPQGVIAEASGLSPANLSDHVATLRASKLVRIHGARQGDPIEPYHDRVREAVMARLDPKLRRALHGALAASFEAREAGPELLFHHFAAAGDHARAARYAELAAEAAGHALAFDRAAALYGSALANGVADPAHRRRLLAALGDRLTDAGRSKEAADSYLAAADAGADAAERLELTRRAAEQLLMSGNLEEGLAATRIVLGASGFSLPTSRLVALARLAWQQLRLGSHSLTWTARRTADVDPRAAARMDLCWSMGAGLGMVDSVRSMLFVNTGALLTLEHGDDGRIARALAAAAVAAGGLGRRVPATRLGDACRRAAAADGSERARFYGVLPSLTFRFFIENDWRSCLNETNEAQRLWRASGHTEGWEADIVDQFATWSLDNLGRFRDLRDRVPAKIRAAQRAGNRFIEVNYRTQFIHLPLIEDRPKDAARDVRDAIASWSPASDDFGNQDYLATRSLTYIALYEEDMAAIESTMPQWARFFGSLMSRVLFLRQDALWYRGVIAVLRAREARARGEASIWKRRLREARGTLAEMSRIPLPMTQTNVLHLRATIAITEGDEDTAREVLREALSFAEARGTELRAAAIRWRLAPLVGGDEGREIRANADRWMAEQGAVAPARLVCAVLPGWPI